MDRVLLAEFNDHFVAIARRAAAACDDVAQVDPAAAAQARVCSAQARELAALHLGHAAALRAMRCAPDRPPFPPTTMAHRSVPAPVVDGDGDLVAVGLGPLS